MTYVGGGGCGGPKSLVISDLRPLFLNLYIHYIIYADLSYRGAIYILICYLFISGSLFRNRLFIIYLFTIHYFAFIYFAFLISLLFNYNSLLFRDL
jgi:hypothetical protein